MSSVLEGVTVFNLLACIVFRTRCEELLGCGGFLKSNFTINYSRVEIKLYTKQGGLKYETDCAPNNGYYLIPVYDKGSFILRIEPPNGWKFNPNSVALHIDGMTDLCSLNKDINFDFMGFTVFGTVVSASANSGPSGIILILKKPSGEIVEKTESTENGHYSFSPVLPGYYVIEASHKKWLFHQHQEDVRVLDDNVKTKNRISVAGYDVRGNVFSDGEPIQGVHFLLFSKYKIQKSFLGCATEMVRGFSQRHSENYLCYVTSASDGSFLFPCVPPGNYTLVPFYKGEHIEFDVSPSKIEFEVLQDSYEFSESFQVQGFSVIGRVLTSADGIVIKGAEIYVDGKWHASTDDEGVYHLENMRTGTYRIDVKVPHILFDSVIWKITPNTPHLPDILASKFSLCGHIHVEKYPGELTGVERFLTLKPVENDNVTSVHADGDGNFCVVVPSGKYVIKPVLSDEEKKFGLKFLPSHQIIDLSHYPILDVFFGQFLARVQGQVNCIEHCGSLPLKIIYTGNSDQQIDITTTSDGKFQLTGCLPGKYLLSIEKDDWCFQAKVKEFDIIDDDILNLDLLQSGFQSIITLSHSSSFKVKYPSGEVHLLQLQNAKNVLCLPEPGSYDFIPVGCHLYRTDSFKFDTNNPVEIEIKPVKHLVTGKILTELNVSDIEVFILKSTGDTHEKIQLEEPVEKEGTFYKYVFSVFAEPNSNLEIRAASAQLLFRPVVAHVKVLNNCIDGAVEIMGKIGLFLNGFVIPPLENAKIQVKDKQSGKKITEVLTSSNGTYSVGPLDSENEYIVTAEKEGYLFVQQDSTNFKCFRLAEIVIEVFTEDGSPLPGVLLSLSGGKDYRKNSLTRQNGRVSFSSLSPGQYFLRPVLKEFRFQPPTKMIDVKEGMLAEVKISGKRVAFSVFGSITSLTGESEVGIAIEASGAGGGECEQQQEEAITEQGGIFRIRGLQPRCKYHLSLKKESDVNQHIMRATPSEILLQVEGNDVTDVHIIAFRHLGQTDLSGNVIASQEYLSTLKVKLYSEDNLDQVLHTVNLGRSNFFFLPSVPMDGKTYTVYLDSSLSSGTYFYTMASIVFCANTTFHHFTFRFDPHPRSPDQEITQGSILALPFVILIALIVYNYSTVFKFMAQIFQALSCVFFPSQSVFSGECATSDSNTVRRKVKPRRMN